MFQREAQRGALMLLRWYELYSARGVEAGALQCDTLVPKYFKEPHAEGFQW
jgi:hypothetical protein